jgi:SAM-dependent methyltransferase
MSSTPEHLESRIKLIQSEIDLISSWGYGNLNFDALFKWANIIYEFHKKFGQIPHGLKILDIGGGLGPLDLYFTNFGKVENIDLSHEKTWFQTDSKGILVGADGPKYVNDNLLRITGDFFSITKNFQKDFDFIYDSCSMIHFQRNFRKNKTNLNYKKMDKSLLIFSEALSKLMHKESLFISATDMSHSSSIEFKEIISQERILNSMNYSGFQSQIIVDENFYTNKYKYRQYKLWKNRSAKKAMVDEDKQIYLTTVWPEKSFIKAKTVIGVFLFAKGQSSSINYSIPANLLIKSWISGMLYFIFNPIQSKIRKVFNK